MKELSIEEKAKRYDEAIEKANSWYTDSQISFKRSLENLFPELKESEDERMRNVAINACKYMVDNFENSTKQYEDAIVWLEKQGDTNETINRDEFAQGVLRGAAINLITWIDYNAAKGNMCLSNMECKDIEDALVSGDWNKIYAYIKKKLEKQGEQKFPIEKLLSEMKTTGESLGFTTQEDCDRYNQMVTDLIMSDDDKGEQKPSDKVEPKFHEGDWVVYDHRVYQVVELPKEGYINLGLRGNEKIEFAPSTYCRLWTIQDAKDGDVLANGSNIFIFHFINSTRLMGYCHVNTDDRRFYDDIGKNECFCLIDGIVNPATKEQRDILFAKMTEAGYTFDFEKKELKKIEQKPATKLEYDENVEPILTPFEAELFSMMSEVWQGYLLGKEVNIAKIVKEHSAELLEIANEQNPVVDDKDAEKASEEYRNFRMSCGIKDPVMLNEIEEAYYEGAIRKQKPAETQIENSPAWSEEDESILQGILDEISANKHDAKEYEWKTYDRFLDWLKSLKERYAWKPSDEQMNTLEHYIHTLICTKHKEVLFGLYDDLKKLREG